MNDEIIEGKPYCECGKDANMGENNTDYHCKTCCKPNYDTWIHNKPKLFMKKPVCDCGDCERKYSNATKDEQEENAEKLAKVFPDK